MFITWYSKNFYRPETQRCYSRREINGLIYPGESPGSFSVILMLPSPSVRMDFFCGFLEFSMRLWTASASKLYSRISFSVLPLL